MPSCRTPLGPFAFAGRRDGAITSSYALPYTVSNRVEHDDHKQPRPK